MLPRVDLPEVILEVMSWVPGFTAAFTSVSGGRARLAGLDISIAACLAAHAMNIGFAPVVTRRPAAGARPARPRRPHLPVRGELSAANAP